MAPIEIIVLLVIAVAFVACADCAQGGACTGHCGKEKSCAAVKGVDEVAAKLGRGVK